MTNSRFKDLPWFNRLRGTDVLVGGAGGIGSWLAFYLAKAGATVHLVDPDYVEDHNLGGQLYLQSHVGVTKVGACREVANFTRCEGRVIGYTETIEEHLSSTSVDGYSIICCTFDNILARKAVFADYLMASNSKVLFVDGRMLAEDGQVFAMVKSMKDRNVVYEHTQLFDDSEVPDQPCSAKATSHCGALVASLMMSVITNHITNRAMDASVREVPYKQEVHLYTSMFNVAVEPSVEQVELALDYFKSHSHLDINEFVERDNEDDEGPRDSGVFGWEQPNMEPDIEGGRDLTDATRDVYGS